MIKCKLGFYGDSGKLIAGRLMDNWLEDNAKVVGQSEEVQNSK